MLYVSYGSSLDTRIKEKVCVCSNPAQLWDDWIMVRFYQEVVFKLFDLGDLAFCPDRDQEQKWRDIFGKRGLLKTIRFPCHAIGKAEVKNLAQSRAKVYLGYAADILKDAVNSYPEHQSYPFADALNYGWINDMYHNFADRLDGDIRA